MAAIKIFAIYERILLPKIFVEHGITNTLLSDRNTLAGCHNPTQGVEGVRNKIGKIPAPYNELQIPSIFLSAAILDGNVKL